MIPPLSSGVSLGEDGYHVFPGDDIQDAIELAAQNPTNKVVKVHAGEYHPKRKRQALIWFNRAHSDIRLIGVGQVTLSAENAQLSAPSTPGYPAVVNHVVYFGDGVSSNTSLEGFRLTGANHSITEKLTKQIEPDTSLPKNLFFYTDGGAIKIFGRSYPTIRNVEIVNNYASPCGAGISVQHLGFNEDSVLIQGCVFRNNRAQVTGAAVDLLEGSAARIINCLFVGNRSNTGPDVVAQRSGEQPFTNNGVLTVFQRSQAIVRNCTFTGNRNGIDDLGGRSVYLSSIFADNDLPGGPTGTKRYELDLRGGSKVEHCVIRGPVRFAQSSGVENVLNPPAPEFDERYVPRASEYQGVGYRPEPASRLPSGGG